MKTRICYFSAESGNTGRAAREAARWAREFGI